MDHYNKLYIFLISLLTIKTQCIANEHSYTYTTACEIMEHRVNIEFFGKPILSIVSSSSAQTSVQKLQSELKQFSNGFIQHKIQQFASAFNSSANISSSSNSNETAHAYKIANEISNIIIEPNSNVSSSSSTNLPNSIAVSVINGMSSVINTNEKQTSSGSGSSNQTIVVADGASNMPEIPKTNTITANATKKINQQIASKNPVSPQIIESIAVKTNKPLLPPEPIVDLDDTYNKNSLAKQQLNLATPPTIITSAAVVKPNLSYNIKPYPLPSPSSAIKSAAKINNLLSKLDNQLKNSGVSTPHLSTPIPTLSLLPVTLSF